MNVSVVVAAEAAGLEVVVSSNITIIKSSNLQSLLKYRHLKILTESNLSCLDWASQLDIYKAEFYRGGINEEKYVNKAAYRSCCISSQYQPAHL